MERNKETLPADYEACGTCGYDHEYDLPLLNGEEHKAALEAHGEKS